MLARRLCGFVMAVLVLWGAPSARAADFTWTGAAAPGVSSWSNGSNWGGSAPAGNVGVLHFPVLTSGACTADPQTATCYAGTDDIGGLTATGLVIDNGAPYVLDGNATLGLGADGIDATGIGSGPASAVFEMPLTLAAAQTWSIDGGAGANPPHHVEMEDTISGPGRALTLNLTHDGIADFFDDVEVGPISASGTDGGVIDLIGNLNGTSGAPVAMNQISVFAAGGVSTGPLSITRSSLAVASSDGGVVTVNGAFSLDAASIAGFTVANGGANVSRLSASGDVNLGGAGLQITADGACPAMPLNSVVTLVTATGSLSGTFGGVPDGGIVVLGGCAGTPTAFELHYSAHAVTATVVPGTQTALSVSTSSPVTNEPVTLSATVTSTTSDAPSGTVEFDNNGAQIPGCGAQPLTQVQGAYRATCQTAFAAAASPGRVRAVFNPAAGSGPRGSASDIQVIVVRKDATAAALAVSNPSPHTGVPVTYTATVTPAHPGSAVPSGSVQFLDGGVPMGSCASRPLSSGSATCTVSYAAAGAHRIAAVFGGDGNFTGATSPASGVTVSGAPTAAQIRARMRAQLAPKGKRANIRAILQRGGFSQAFAALTGGSLQIQWFYLPRGAHLSKAKPVAIARGSRSYTAAGTATVKLKLTAAGRRLLKRAKHMPLTAKGTFVMPGGTRVTTTRAFNLKR